MPFTTIEVRRERSVGWLTFNRPQVLNAFNAALVRETGAALAELAADPTVAAIVVHGAGRAFSAGFDIKESAAAGRRTPAEWRRVLEDDFEFIMQFWDCPKPTIAAVHGHCLGGAFELALACDLTIAARGALLGEPEVRFGSGIVAMLLPWITGPKAAKEILLTGEDRLPAERAHALGLVNHLVDAADLLPRAESIACRIAAAAPDAVRMTKRAINRSYEAMGLRHALLQALEIEIGIETAGGPEREEFDRLRREQGLKAALAWRDARSPR